MRVRCAHVRAFPSLLKENKFALERAGIRSAVACQCLLDSLLDTSSLRCKRSRTKRTKFWPRVLVFCILDERKMGQEQKGERNGVGEGKGENACPQTPRFWKTRSPTGLLIGAGWSSWLTSVSSSFEWLQWLSESKSFSCCYIIDRTRRSNRNQRTLATSLSSTESFFVFR